MLSNESVFSEIASITSDFGYETYCSHPILDAKGQATGAISVLAKEHLSDAASIHELIDDFMPVARLAIEHDERARALDSADIRFSALAESIPGVVYQRVVTPDGDIYYTYISEGAREFFGVSPAEILADPNALFDCQAPEYRETFNDRLLEASRRLEMWDVEAPIIARNGTHKWSHAIARPYRREDGAVVWNGIILDNTRIKEANIELAALNRAKSDFLANISHELRTPLNAILGFSEILTKSMYGPLGDPHYEDYARDIYQSGAHLLNLINDILDITKIEVGKLDLIEDEFDLVHAAEACVRIVNGRAKEKDIHIELVADKNIYRLFGDERKLKQSLINLLCNAIKFSPQSGHVAVTVRLDDRQQIVVSVADEGVGIPSSHLDKVFEPFIQVETGLDRPHDGAGLGLPLTKAITELHGGNIGVSSQEGRGSTFTLTFPADRTRLAQQATRQLQSA